MSDSKVTTSVIPSQVVHKVCNTEMIELIAEDKGYTKIHYQKNAASGYAERRKHFVSLPQVRDKIAFNNAADLFAHLMTNSGYIKGVFKN